MLQTLPAMQSVAAQDVYDSASEALAKPLAALNGR